MTLPFWLRDLSSHSHDSASTWVCSRGTAHSPIMVATGWNKLTVQAGDICRILLSRSSCLVQRGRGLHVDVNTKKQGSWGPPWRLPVTPTLGQHYPSLPWLGLLLSILSWCFGRNNPTTAPLGSRARQMSPAWTVSLFHPVATMIGL